jgi:chromosome segregation ATPase
MKARLELSIEELTTQLAQASEAKAQLEKEAADEKASLATAQSTIDKHSENLSRTEEANAELETRLRTVVEEKVRLEAERTEAASKLAAAEAKIAAYKSAQEEYLKQKEELVAQVLVNIDLCVLDKKMNWNSLG